MAKDDNTDFEAKIKALEAKISEQDKEAQRQQERLLSLMAQPQGHTSQPQRVELPREPEMNYDGLPDILVDQKGHYAELARRQKAHAKEVREYEAQVKKLSVSAADPGPRVNESQLWELYQEDHPAYAKSEAKVRAAAGIAIERMQRRGQDPMALMQRSPEDFFRKINEVYVKEFGDPAKPDKEADADDDADDGSDGEDGRTAGLFGGQDSGGKPAKGKGEDKGESMSKQLADLQDSLWAKPRAG